MQLTEGLRAVIWASQETAEPYLFRLIENLYVSDNQEL